MTLTELAERVDEFHRRSQAIGNADLTPAGQAAALALLLSLNFDLFPQVAAALRARGEG